MEQKQKDNFIILFGAIILSYFTYLTVMDGLSGHLNDYYGHTYVYLPAFTGGNWLKGWLTVPYPMWHLIVLAFNKMLHIPLDMSAAYASCIFAMMSYAVFYWIIQKFSVRIGSKRTALSNACLAFAMCIVQSLYFKWMDLGNGFVGTYSINPIHNAAQMALRPFALLCICLAYDIWQKQKEDAYKGIFFAVEKGLKKYYFLLAGLLFLSAFAKPTFAEMFIPALGIVMLWDWFAAIFRKDGSAKPFFKKCFMMLCCAIPTLLYILVQALAYTIWGGRLATESSFIFTKVFEVWELYTENVALSILMGMAFPLVVLLINLKFFLQDDLGRLGLAGYGIGLLEAAVLGESGAGFEHGNFLWPMMSGMLVMWLVALLRLLALEEEQSDTKIKRFLINVAWFVFALHFFYGLLFLKNM